MSKKTDVIKKEEYQFLKELEGKFRDTVRVRTIKGYDRSDLKEIEAIFKNYGGQKHFSFSTCSNCAFKMINKMVQFIEAYEDRYMGRKTKQETEDTTSSTEEASEQE